MKAELVIVLGLSSIVFFSMLLMGLALYMRRHWDDLADAATRDSAQPKAHEDAPTTSSAPLK